MVDSNKPSVLPITNPSAMSIFNKIKRWAPILISIAAVLYSKAAFDREGRYAGDISTQSLEKLERTIIAPQPIELELTNFSKNTTSIELKIYSENFYLNYDKNLNYYTRILPFRGVTVPSGQSRSYKFFIFSQAGWPETARLMIYINGYKMHDFRYQREPSSARYVYHP